MTSIFGRREYIYVHLSYFSQINLPLHCSAQRDAESNGQLCFTHLLDPSTIMPFPRLLRLVDDLFCFCLLLSWFICKDRLCIMCLDYWRLNDMAKGKFVPDNFCSAAWYLKVKSITTLTGRAISINSPFHRGKTQVVDLQFNMDSQHSSLWCRSHATTCSSPPHRPLVLTLTSDFIQNHRIAITSKQKQGDFIMAELIISAVVGDMVGRVISLLAGPLKDQQCSEAKLRKICHVLVKVYSAVEEA